MAAAIVPARAVSCILIHFKWIMEKERRQQAILEILRRDSVSSQEELRTRLEQEGFEVTQATLSRDLKELGVVKTTTAEGEYKYTVLVRSPASPVLRVEASGNLLVLRTETGMAPAVAYRVDSMKHPAILGSVAGEDTLLVVVAEGYDAQEVKKELWQRLQAT